MKIDELAKETIEKILQKYHNRADWDKRSLSRMIEQELKNYNEEVRKLIEEEIYKILGELYTPFSENKELAISPVVLSEMLYKNAKNLSKEVTKILYESIKAKETIGVIAKKLYEGYGFKDKEVLEVIDRDLPKYIRDALKKGDTKKVIKQIEKLRTKPLRIAYKEIFRKLDEMNAEALEKAMKSAYHEKMRYYAKRIADTETHRALMSKRAYEYLNDENVEFVKFTMSSAHKIKDICDFYANLDIGYGRGIVPKKEMRTLPLHPHCSCVYDPYYREVKGKKKTWKQAVKNTMSQFSEYEQRQILGTKEMLARFKSGEDIEKIFNTIRPKYPIKKYVDVFGNADIESMKQFKQKFYSYGEFAKKYTFPKNKEIKDLEEFQNSINKILKITKNKYEGGIIHLKNGGVSEFFTNYSENVLKIPKEYVNLLEGSVLVHNHPNGTAPSIQDLAEVIVNKMKGVVVVSNHFHYKFILNEDVDLEYLKKYVKIAIKKKNEIFKTAMEKENISIEELNFNEMHYIMSFIADNVKGVSYGRY